MTFQFKVKIYTCKPTWRYPSRTKVLIPFENEKDLSEIPSTIKKNVEIIPVKNVDEVLKIALTKNLKRVEWVEVEQISKKNNPKTSTTRRPN